MLLGGKCEKCGATDNLHFDHKDPSKKEFGIARNINAPDDVLEAEVKKCRLLCSDCHHAKTMDKSEYGKPSEHGTLWKYLKHKCRCDECKKTVSEYYKKRRQNATD